MVDNEKKSMWGGYIEPQDWMIDEILGTCVGIIWINGSSGSFLISGKKTTEDEYRKDLKQRCLNSSRGIFLIYRELYENTHSISFNVLERYLTGIPINADTDKHIADIDLTEECLRSGIGVLKGIAEAYRAAIGETVSNTIRTLPPKRKSFIVPSEKQKVMYERLCKRIKVLGEN